VYKRQGWLPPFNRSINYEPKKIKINLDVKWDIINNDRLLSIIFGSKANHICSGRHFLFDFLCFIYLNLFCKNIISFGFSKVHARFFFNINDILKFLDFLIENVEDDGNRKKLQNFREEVLQWENK